MNINRFNTSQIEPLRLIHISLEGSVDRVPRAVSVQSQQIPTTRLQFYTYFPEPVISLNFHGTARGKKPEINAPRKHPRGG